MIILNGLENKNIIDDKFTNNSKISRIRILLLSSFVENIEKKIMQFNVEFNLGPVKLICLMLMDNKGVDKNDMLAFLVLGFKSSQ